MAERIKILVDTDPGSDIDDAVCLAYLLANPRCELLGITTVDKEPEQRARLASAVCRGFGRDDIPIYPGAARPLLGPPRSPYPVQTQALAACPHQMDFPANEAVNFLRQTIRAHPGEITLLAIAPLTNVGLLFALDPEIPSLLRGLVLMGGQFTGWRGHPDDAEWNLRLDPHAAAIVYQSAVPVHRTVGYEVTKHLRFGPEEADALLTGERLAPVRAMAAQWFRTAKWMLFYDVIAAATLFSDDICRFKPGRVRIGLPEDASAGLSYWHPAPGFATADPHEAAPLPAEMRPPHEIAADFAPEAFLAHLRETLRGERS